MLTQSLAEMQLGLLAAQQAAPILTPEIISRLRLIFLFYKTLHFPFDPRTPSGELRRLAPAGILNQLVFELPSGVGMTQPTDLPVPGSGDRRPLVSVISPFVRVNTGNTVASGIFVRGRPDWLAALGCLLHPGCN